MKLFITETGRDNLKCGGCNWETYRFYGLGNSKRDARSDFKKEQGCEKGLCGSCMCDLLVEVGYEVKRDDKK